MASFSTDLIIAYNTNNPIVYTQYYVGIIDSHGILINTQYLSIDSTSGTFTVAGTRYYRTFTKINYNLGDIMFLISTTDGFTYNISNFYVLVSDFSVSFINLIY